MERAPFTARHLKGSKFERSLTQYIHSQLTPVLIDAQLLRKRGLGQVDCCALDSQALYLFEAKFSQFQRSNLLSLSQQRRLKRSGNFLSLLFKRPYYLKVITNKKNFD